MSLYTSMQTVFESSSAKQPSPSSPSNCSTITNSTQDFRTTEDESSPCGICWQTDTIMSDIQYPSQQEDGSMWNNNYLTPSYGGQQQHDMRYATNYSYTEPQECHWQELQDNSGVTVTEMMEDGRGIDVKDVLDDDAQCKYQQHSSRRGYEDHQKGLKLHYSRTAAEKSTAERLHNFPVLRRAVLKWANMLKIKQEYLLPHSDKDNIVVLNKDSTRDLKNNGQQKWSHHHHHCETFPSCVYHQDFTVTTDEKKEPCGDNASPSSHIVEVANLATLTATTGTLSEHSSSSSASSNAMSSYEEWNSPGYVLTTTTTAQCAKYLPCRQPVISTTKRINADKVNIKTASDTVNRTLTKVCNGDNKVASSKAKNSDNVPCHDTLENAVGQAIGLLSSDQLHLLDEVTTSLIFRPAPT